MILNQLPPLSPRRHLQVLHVLQSWAFTQLAYYADLPIPARSSTSFFRAYAPTSIERFARTPEGVPAFIVAKWENTSPRRALVAIEGTREWNQILRWTSTAGTAVEAGRDGRVLQTFLTCAEQVRLQLAAAGFLDWVGSHSQKVITFAGHSLGAATAEIIADWYARNVPHCQFYLDKFGAPRVGSYRYVGSQTVMNGRVSIYAMEDQIHTIPVTQINREALLPVNPLFDNNFLVADANRETWSDRGSRTYSPENTTPAYGVASLVRWLTELPDIRNPWNWHHRNKYRYVATEVNEFETGVDRFRFRYIEMPDENTWGVAFQAGAGLTDAMLQVQAPPPADVDDGYFPPVGVPPVSPAAPTTLPRAATGMGVENIHRGQFGGQPYRRGHSVRP